MSRVIVVHGGAGRVASDLDAAALAGVREAGQAGCAVLAAGGSAEDAVVAAVRSMEDDPTFNAGRGACMNAAGNFEMDAGIMGSDLRSGAVAAVPDLCDPIALAQAVMHRSEHCLIAADGAVMFARAQGVGRFGRAEVWTQKAQARFDAARRRPGLSTGQADTVGAVALDASGKTCVGCSTGGVLCKSVGRVGDSPIIGAGFYASAALGAACATGVGEVIMTRVAAYEALRRVASGEQPREAAGSVCREAVGDTAATCGIILVDPRGRVGVAHASPDMSWAVARPGAGIESGLRR